MLNTSNDLEARWGETVTLLGFTPAHKPVCWGRVLHGAGDIDGMPCELHVGVPGELEQARACAPGVFQPVLWTSPGVALCEPGEYPGRVRAREVLELLESITTPGEPVRVVPFALWARDMFGETTDRLWAMTDGEEHQSVFLDFAGISRNTSGQVILSPQPLVEAPLGFALALWVVVSGSGRGGVVETLEEHGGVDVTGWVRVLNSLKQARKQDNEEG